MMADAGAVRALSPQERQGAMTLAGLDGRGKPVYNQFI